MILGVLSSRVLSSRHGCLGPLVRSSILKATFTSKVVTITSGKGGVGKTTTAASFAYGLAEQGHKTCVIDFDIGLRNLDIHLGCERRVIFDFVNVLQKECTLNQVLSYHIISYHTISYHIVAYSFETSHSSFSVISSVSLHYSIYSSLRNGNRLPFR